MLSHLRPFVSSPVLCINAAKFTFLMSEEDNVELLSSMQQTFLRMEERLTTMCVDVENLKRTKIPVWVREHSALAIVITK